MWNGHIVVDAVAHAYDFVPSNRPADCPPEAFAGLITWLYGFAHRPLESLEPGYLLSLEEFSGGWDADELASVFFEESDVDLIAYHHVEISALFGRGPSPWPVGVELKRRWPDRVLLYACADPLKGPSELEAMEALVAECPVDAFKFYPSNGVLDQANNRAFSTMYDDPERAFPFFEKARELGVPRVAIHKAMPVGPGPLDKDRIDDISTAAVAFPDVTFEVVHSGWAFLEDCALQYMVHPNIWANLECVVNWVTRQPARFAHVLGTLLLYGGDDRIVFGTGCALGHPQPILEAFGDFEMPAELRDGYGYPAVTESTKRKILGDNMLRLHGLDADAVRRAVTGDEWADRRRAYLAGEPTPWRAHRARMAVAAEPAWVTA